MKTITEPSRNIEIRKQADVLVAGGGIAGIAAAAAAARGGKRVTLVEREYGLGGMATLGLVTIYLPLDDGLGNQVVFGLGEELLHLSMKHGAEANYPAAWLDGGTREERIEHRYIVQFNPHLFALEAERLLLDLGVDILYGTSLAGAATENGRVAAVFLENKSGRTAAEAASYVDCTGDADLFALAGADTALHAGGNGLASWYYYFSEGKVTLKMFGLADVVPEDGSGASGKADDGRDYDNNVKVESLGALRFSG
ncbi:MAG: FAD-dependent oxidoreductase, partial [Clostridiales Family XIII bacterium]|nr:FAD-dependent oxidoreductase [Clostridiales Family XIII bacterium]